MGFLRPGEEEWQDVYDRLCERFPQYGAEKVSVILRENNGHAGQAAAALRDLGGTEKRAVDPDDQEHVKTLLTSPAMFAAVCKDNFRKFDSNRDGFLEYDEVTPLVINLYEGFGLQPPREGFVKSFFEANDTNKDGVLSEGEFKHFFESLLRYAFFDVVNKGARPPRPTYEDTQSDPPSERPPKPRKAEARDRHDDEESVKPRRRKEESNGPRQAPTPSRSESKPALGSLRVLAPYGVSVRNTPDVDDRTEMSMKKGEVVTVLEQWVKTDKGWLPVFDQHGQPLLEAVPATKGAGAAPRREKKSRPVETEKDSPPSIRPQKPAEMADRKAEAVPSRKDESEGFLRPGEEDWEDRFVRLRERFSQLSDAQILGALRSNGGHAGHTASALRELAMQM
eukprot:CAMPEP_0197625846 /NCGR_PEP_ID=MMETSP1338-20131121/5094_1 /TAXON_ID=43686 ORGANISM="Pelagodinium beii, Strain RCC1491" /NCGR_SAMPLE_ID=MMETSP1338 /ASSEMBLY_ACC=CAM_ASM_000754 /LENGTH=394 /DNA_ID=CAMNT_0043196351 /DNA_START=57 /DNA_END=1241 /DNA_ORIENTATION=-